MMSVRQCSKQHQRVLVAADLGLQLVSTGDLLRFYQQMPGRFAFVGWIVGQYTLTIDVYFICGKPIMLACNTAIALLAKVQAEIGINLELSSGKSRGFPALIQIVSLELEESQVTFKLCPRNACRVALLVGSLP